MKPKYLTHLVNFESKGVFSCLHRFWATYIRDLAEYEKQVLNQAVWLAEFIFSHSSRLVFGEL